MQKIEFLGFMVTPTGISMDMAKTNMVSVWLTLTNLNAVQAFLGFTNFYPQFIVGFSDIVIEKIAFTQAPILVHFNPDNPIVGETDASDYATTAIISQISPNNGNIHPITFYSCSMQLLGVSALHYSTGSTEGSERFRCWIQLIVKNGFSDPTKGQ